MDSEFFRFFDSNLMQTIVTLIVGFVAFYIYLRQKRDEKSSAANSIFLEIQHIEACIPKVKTSVRRGTLNDIDFGIMRDDSWSRHSHMFSNNFDKDEWEAITEFYQKARLLDRAIQASIESFALDVSEIRVNKQRVIADITKDTLDIAGSDAERNVDMYNKMLDVFDKLYMSRQDDFAYTPVKHINDAKKYLEDMQKLTITGIGKKLKKIARIKK